MAEALTAAVAIGWGMKAAGWVASPIISDLFKKASSYLGFDASEKLTELEPKILLLERVMGAVEGSPCRPRLEGLYNKLKSAFYEAEEILDDVEYYRLEKKIHDDTLKSEVAGPSRHLKHIWSAVKSSPLKHKVIHMVSHWVQLWALLSPVGQRDAMATWMHTAPDGV
ncbi:uncharacterized protein LOC124661151 [Lolium rigidum]|uniref:uncharacterized protein LOC124661151 n=1 Tax=Lolium rigidum TaxID=89674 RepID=UPI001F5CE04B|nr:uncharacterized protein LOC124661151 [Lolium rigidum]